ncbi:MAG: cation:proton antiporter [Myxococcota bacterium]|nr:cation:proton antiporter [Myxococcota bacterium]
MERTFALLALIFSMYLLAVLVPSPLVVPEASATLSFGFLILSAYLIAAALSRVGLPKITGYILSGMLFGPSIIGFLTPKDIGDLKLVDDLALTFIAFAAGGELRLATLRERRKSILLILVCQITIVFIGIFGTILALQSTSGLTVHRSTVEVLAIAGICGVIAIARSPSSAIAVIGETKSHGPFTEMILGVTVAADVLTIFLFAVVLSLSELLVCAGQSFNFVFLLGIGSQVAASVIIGLLLGRGIVLYLEKVGKELPIFILGVALLVAKLSHAFGAFLDREFNLQFHLEPMLICLVAGFFIQNFSQFGGRFLRVIERSALPVYAIFFALSGASLTLGALKTTWHMAIILVIARLAFLYAGTYLGARLSSDPPRFKLASGVGFITQAGVSLGLIKVVGDRLPGFGLPLATLLVATIAINQLIGPVALKQALTYVGETRAARLNR